MAKQRKPADVFEVDGKPVSKTKERGMRPASNPESREKQMIALAERLAEKQLREGTASSQVIVHYLKLGTEKAKLERSILEANMKLVTAKTNSIEESRNAAEAAEAAIEAMKRYSGG